jgi:hypothetical protein
VRITFALLLVLVSCTRSADNSNVTEDCSTYNFVRRIDKYDITAQYVACEPNWKTRLAILNGQKVVYRADSLTDFEFKEHSWPDYLKISENKDQLLLEVNDRPYSNYILCLTIVDDVLVSSDTFHLFQHDPKDFDGDGLLEYAGFPLTVEGYTKDSTYYNPICYIEKGPNGFQLDTVLAKAVNIKLYGEFLGLHSGDKIYKKVPIDTLDKYLNRDE